eukprot:c26788_g1_i1.p1 GENE.c26788_g1_i1~~c26788_g1_i1.p1  ORF type:complete len:288 (+),score=50.21 c26788_g1_i1:137-1000(+)
MACCSKFGLFKPQRGRESIRASDFEDRDHETSLVNTSLDDGGNRDEHEAVGGRAAFEPSPEFDAVRAALRKDLVTNFDYANAEHAALVQRLFAAVFPRGRLNSELISTEWKTMGFQRTNPAPDFRSSGLLGLRLLIYFFEHYPEAGRLIIETHRPREETHYPVAAAGIALAMVVADMLQLRLGPEEVLRTRIFRELQQWVRGIDDVGEMFSALVTHFEDKWHEHRARYMTFPAELALLRERLENAVPRPRDADAVRHAFNRHMFEERLNDDSLLPERPPPARSCAIQ